MGRLNDLKFRDVLKELITSSDSRLSIGKIDQFLKNSFGASQTLPLELFLANFLDVQNNFIEKFSTRSPKNSRPSGCAEVFVKIDPAENLSENEFEIEEPDFTTRGAFFHSDGER